MKKSFLKVLSLAAVTGLMAFTTACNPPREEYSPGVADYDLLIDVADLPEYLPYDLQDFPEFNSFSGTVAEINPFYEDDGTFFVLVQGEEDEYGYSPTVNFVVDHLSAMLLDGELEVGMEVTGFYETGAAIVMIYPPQHNVRVLASNPDVVVQRFESFEPAEYTQIHFQDGTPFEGEPEELANRILAVVGGVYTPSKAVVLFERAVHPIHWFTEEELLEFGFYSDAPDFVQPDFGWEGGLQLTQEDLDIMWDNMFDPETVQIIVNDSVIDSPKPFIDRDAGKIMLPVAAIAEALGYTVTGSGFDMTIGMYGYAPHTIVFVEGEDTYLIGRLETISLGAPPALVDDTLFVPMNFFGQVMSAGAWVAYGEVFVNELNDMM